MRRFVLKIFGLTFAFGAALLLPSPASAQLLNNAPGWSLISVQSTTTSSSIQFTGANFSNNYNMLFLSCEDLIPSSTSGGIDMEVGEGTGASFAWETSSNYTNIGGSTTCPSLLCGGYNPPNTTTPTSLKAFMYNPGSSSVVKVVFNYEYGIVNLAKGNLTTDQSWWNADTNPITGWEVYNGAGTFKSGTCSLWGMM